jgi:hypothetical protein
MKDIFNYKMNILKLRGISKKPNQSQESILSNENINFSQKYLLEKRRARGKIISKTIS